MIVETIECPLLKAPCMMLKCAFYLPKRNEMPDPCAIRALAISCASLHQEVSEISGQLAELMKSK